MPPSPCARSFVDAWVNAPGAAEARAGVIAAVLATGSPPRVLGPRQLPDSLLFVDAWWIRPYAAELVDMPASEVNAMPESLFVALFAFRALYYAAPSAMGARAGAAEPATHGPPASVPPTAANVAAVSVASSSASVSRAASEVGGPTITAGAAPTTDRGGATSRAAIPTREGLPNVPEEALTTSCRAHAYVREVLLCDEEDATAIEWRQRSIHVAPVYRMRTAALQDPHVVRQAMRMATEFPESLIVPAALRSPNSEKAREAWKAYRPVFAAKLRLPIQSGADWATLLTFFTNRMGLTGDTDKTRGFPRIHGYLTDAQRDTVLHAYPALHAEALLFQIDASFDSGGASAQSYETDWRQCKSRKSTVDVRSLANTIISAWIKKKRDPATTTETVWQMASDRSEIAQRYQECLQEDEDHPDRGKYLADEFIKAWVSLEAKVHACVKSASVLDIRELARFQLEPLERIWMHKNSATPKAKTTTAAKAPAAASTNTVAAAVATSEAPPADVPPPAMSTRAQRRAAAVERRVAAAVAQAVKGTTPAPAPVVMAQPVAPRAVGAAIPPPAPQSQSALRAVPPPAGSMGEPQQREWTSQLWQEASVDFDNLDRAVGAGGTPTTMTSAVARARPADASMTQPRLGRPQNQYGQPWPDDACAYCRFRPKAPGPNAANGEDAWRYGTGDGAHNPYRCRAFKRYLAEGGDATNSEDEKAFLRLSLRYAPSQPQRQQRQ